MFLLINGSQLSLLWYPVPSCTSFGFEQFRLRSRQERTLAPVMPAEVSTHKSHCGCEVDTSIRKLKHTSVAIEEIPSGSHSRQPAILPCPPKRVHARHGETAARVRASWYRGVKLAADRSSRCRSRECKFMVFVAEQRRGRCRNQGMGER